MPLPGYHVLEFRQVRTSLHSSRPPYLPDVSMTGLGMYLLKCLGVAELAACSVGIVV